jgi:predicted DNA-binding antitoxin AbrB/MazE fold protein
MGADDILASMAHSIAAIFDAGVFRPLEPVEMANGTQVVVQVQGNGPLVSDDVDEETRKAWSDYLDRMESRPDSTPQDGLTNRDHDRILYGG